MVGLPADLLTEYLVFHPIRVCLKCLVPRLLNFLQTQKTSVVNPRFIGPIIFFYVPWNLLFFYGESQEIHIFLWWIPGNLPFSHEISMRWTTTPPRLSRRDRPWPPRHPDPLRPRGSSQRPPWRSTEGFRRTKKWGEYYRYIYIYIYNSKNRYVLKKLSWYIIFLQWYITINGIPLKKMGVDKSLKACGDSKCDTCQMPMGFTIWLYECEKDVHGRSDVSNFTIYIYVYVCNVSVEMSIPISSV